MSSKKLIVVVGPTAIGKTKLAISLAEYFGTEIISSDSRQFFREMNIGTAVPSTEELNAIPHHFIQNISIHESYSVGDFERDALTKLDTLYETKDYAIMVGGSGLYTDAVVYGLDEFPEVNPDIRVELNQKLEHEGIEGLQQELKDKDPVYYERVDLMNPHRLIRALEICISTGSPYSSFLKKNTVKRSFETIYVGITADREIIYDRINLRVDQMIHNGLVEEARSLHEHQHLNALQTVGYKELFRFFDNEITLDFAIDEIKKNTRRFAKRQMTWLRKNSEILWINHDDAIDGIITLINQKIQAIDR